MEKVDALVNIFLCEKNAFIQPINGDKVFAFLLPYRGVRCNSE